jgi:GNAT superfamily N-acetyltransferase
MFDGGSSVARLCVDDIFEEEVEDFNRLLGQLSEGSVTSLELLRASAAQQNGFVLIVRSEEEPRKHRIVGTVTFRIDCDLAGKLGVIRRLVVDKDFRRKGFGRSLMTYCERYAKENGVRQLALDSDTHLPEREIAAKFYQTLGFGEHKTTAFRKVVS